MTKVTINPGVCGFITTVEVKRTAKRRVSVSIVSDCERMAQLAEALKEMNAWDTLKPRAESEVHQLTLKHPIHPACPIPTGILKAVEVEAELALPRDVSIHFEN